MVSANAQLLRRGVHDDILNAQRSDGSVERVAVAREAFHGTAREGAAVTGDKPPVPPPLDAEHMQPAFACYRHSTKLLTSAVRLAAAALAVDRHRLLLPVVVP